MNVQHAIFRNHAAEQSSFSSLRHRTAAVAEAAASAAKAVDREACFPQKAIDAARRERLLGAQIPVEFGGDGVRDRGMERLLARVEQLESGAA